MIDPIGTCDIGAPGKGADYEVLMRLKVSMMRAESRCSHYRLNYPDVDYENWKARINIYKDDKGGM